MIDISRFIWATGIEDTLIARPDPRTGRSLDEYELTEHYQRWETDLQLMAELGVTHARYGIPWHRVNPAPGRFDWSWTDPALERLVNVHGIVPIIDLVHYGTPEWMERSFSDPDFPAWMADYAAAFAERYQGVCTWYTPLNEPRIAAWYSGRIGLWPPYLRSYRGFVQVMLQLCRGICLTQRAISQVSRSSVFVHVDATDLYVPVDSGDNALGDAASHRQEIVFLALDLVMGRVDSTHRLWGWLDRHGADDWDFDWFQENAVNPDIIGYNMYPMFSRKVVGGEPSGSSVTIRPCWTETLTALTRLYAERYAPIPVMLTETAATPRRKVRWIADSAEALQDLRMKGVPVVGYTYWPLISMVSWAYQRGYRDVEEYCYQIGLWDLEPSTMNRIRTPAADAYTSVIHRYARGL